MTNQASQLESDRTGNEGGLSPAASPDSIAQDPPQKKSRWRSRITLAGLAAILLAAAIVVPPLINIGRYQRQVTALMTQAMGRPVHLSSVGLQLLPRPGFVLHDLSVSEDPAFGAEPILFARTVEASVAIFPLWRGRLQIDRVGVDEASLNLVRNMQGRWNLESLMMGAKSEITGVAGGSSPVRKPVPFPYLEASNSRVNLKNGIVKSPFSIVNADLALWQDEPGAWRVRLKGQPVRTDMELSQGDTGELRFEASLRTAGHQLRDMPIKLQAEWRDAELGQLSRMITGSDAGWRGEVRADVEVIGSPESAQTKARLRATQVHREEFAPDTPLDFDANCDFRYQRSRNAFHNLSCTTELGTGRLHLAAELPGPSGSPEVMLEVQQIPVQAGLDLLRTVRSGFAPGIQVKGVANGSLTYRPEPAAETSRSLKIKSRRGRSSRPDSKPDPTSNRLAGSITVEQAALKGGGLKDPLTLPKMIWTPISPADPAPGIGQNISSGLGARFTVSLAPKSQSQFQISRRPSARSAPDQPDSPPPAEATPLNPSLTQPETKSPDAANAEIQAAAQFITVQVEVSAEGFAVDASGAADVAVLRTLAYAFGSPHLQIVDTLSSGSAELKFASAGPWIASIPAPLAEEPLSSPSQDDSSGPFSDSFSGSLQLHRLRWQPPYLPRPVDLPQGVATFHGSQLTLTSGFSLGPSKSLVEGTVTAAADLACDPAKCPPRIALHFLSLDAAALQTALTEVPEEPSMLAPILEQVDKLRSPSKPEWPAALVHGSVESLTLGPTTLHKVVLDAHLTSVECNLDSWQAEALGGSASGTGSATWTGGKPEYSFEGTLSGLSAAALGALTANRWTGGPIQGSGKLRLAGSTRAELAASASGNLDFSWSRGAISVLAPAQSIRFDRWTGTATIGSGKLQLGKNQISLGRQSAALAGAISFDGPARLTLTGNSLGRPGRRPIRTIEK